MIGILGGMGPRATAQFHKLILDLCEGDDQSLPAILCLNDGNIPDRSKYLTGKGEDPMPAMISRANILENAGARIICVPCNTAQTPILHKRLTASLTTPVIHMPTQVVSTIETLGIKKVLLLATDGTVRSGMYQSLCSKYKIDCLAPDSVMQESVMELIRSIKADDRTNIKRLCLSLSNYIAESGVEAVVLGCTELPLVAKKIAVKGVVQLDSLDILARACINTVKRGKDESR